MATKSNERHHIVFPVGCDPVKIWKLIEAFTPTVLVRFNPEEGLYVQCMDSGHTSMLLWELRPEHCDTYTVSDTGSMCISVPDMIKILANAGAGSTVTWTFTTDADQLHITVTPKPGSMFSGANYGMRLLDSDEGLMAVPPTVYISAVVPTKAYKHAVTHLRGLSSEVSHVYIYLGERDDETCLVCGVETSGVPRASMYIPVLNNKHETIRADGDDDDEDTQESIGHILNENLDHAKKDHMAYPATLFNKVLDAGKELGGNTRVHWDTSSPLLLTFVDPAMCVEPASPERSSYGFVRVFLAPRSDDSHTESQNNDT